MSRIRLISLVLVGLCAATGASAAVAESWTKLKAGMPANDAVATLGHPLIRSSGRGFEVWVYDSGAEVVCLLGTVVAWTGPEGQRTSEGRDIDVRGIKPIAMSAVPPSAERAPEETGHGYDALRSRTIRLPRW